MPNALLKRLSSASLFVAMAVAMAIVSVMLAGGGADRVYTRTSQCPRPVQAVYTDDVRHPV